MAKIRIFNTNLKNNQSLFASFNTNPVHNQYNKHNLMSDTFMSKKLSRFVFPKQDLVDPKWVVTHIPPLKSLFSFDEPILGNDNLGRDVSKTGQK